MHRIENSGMSQKKAIVIPICKEKFEDKIKCKILNDVRFSIKCMKLVVISREFRENPK